MRETLDARRGSSAIDPDEFFQKEREWAAEYGSHLRDVCDRFQSMLNSQLRLANQGQDIMTFVSRQMGFTSAKTCITHNVQGGLIDFTPEK